MWRIRGRENERESEEGGERDKQREKYSERKRRTITGNRQFGELFEH